MKRAAPARGRRPAQRCLTPSPAAVYWVEVDHVVGAAADRLKDLVHETPVWVLHGNAGTVFDIPCNHVAEEGALAGSAFAIDCDVFPALLRFAKYSDSPSS